MHRRLALLLALLLLPPLARAATNPPAALDFPRPDRAEIFSIAPGTQDGPKADLSTAKARKVLKLLRAFTWLGPAAQCDKIQYILNFYANDKLVASEGLCFHCGCFTPLDASRHSAGDTLTFDLQNANAQALDSYLAKFFPPAK